MRRITDTDIIQNIIDESKHKEMFNSMKLDKYICEYDPGEFLCAPWQQDDYIHIVIEGNLSIYFVRNDGCRFSLAQGTTDYILGDMELFLANDMNVTDNIYVEAITKVITIAVNLKDHREALYNNILFVQFAARKLAEKISAITAMDARDASLEERVISYMIFKCENGILKGVENASFHLHCSSRQLQRIMNKHVKNGIIEKIGKGSYQLLNT